MGRMIFISFKAISDCYRFYLKLVFTKFELLKVPNILYFEYGCLFSYVMLF
jgi:hypothetical protein